MRFTWTGGDPDSEDTLTYIFMLGQDKSALSVATITRLTSYDAEGLELGKTWFWQIIAADNRGKETQGPVWQFSTYSTPNRAPADPVMAYPASGATNLPVDVQFRWQASDPDGDALTFDVFLGKTFPLPKLGENLVSPVYSPSPYLEHSSRYYLQVVVRDDEGLTNKNSPVWSFETGEKVNGSPNVPTAIYPIDAATGVSLRPVFSWNGGDPDGDSVTYDLYLSKTFPFAGAFAQSLGNTNYTTQTDLDKGSKYYWQIEARDSANNLVKSAVFTFFTVSDVDLEAPKLVEVSPADNSGDVPGNAAIRIVFSEPVNKILAEGAFSFLPTQEGSWTWENDATVRFWPKESWLPGSYHKFIIAENQIKDIAGNTMAGGAISRFTVASAIPVPAGYKSAGFPVNAVAGDLVKVAIPELQSGKRACAVVVGGSSATSLTVKGNILGNWFDSAPEAAFREFEKRLTQFSLPTIMRSVGDNAIRTSILASQDVGTTSEFYIPSYGSVATSTTFPNNKITATCLGISGSVYVYVDSSIRNPSSTLISDVRMRFEEGILPKMRDVFGSEPELGPDGDPRITILLTDSMTTGIAGIFYGADLFANDAGDVQLKESNGRKIFYVKYGLSSEITRYGTLAHEFQHMINFWQKRVNGGQGVFEETWLNEGLSKYAEEVCGYGILQGDENTALLIKLTQEDFNNLSVSEWSGINSYGLSYLFMRFIAQENRYGTTYKDVTRALINSSLTGAQNVESVTKESFAQTLARLGMALYINDFSSSDPQQYGFKGLNLAGTYSGVALPGFNFTTIPASGEEKVSLRPDVIRGFAKTSVGGAVTELEFSGFSGAADLWLFDQR